jgi:UDP-glucose 4-epimerase
MINSKNFKRAVVLGAGGFIGLNLVAYLVEQGLEVTCFDRVDNPNWPSHVHRIIGEFTNPPTALIQSLDNALVFHLVSSCRPSNSTASSAKELMDDVASTVRYLEASKNFNTRWIFVSSGGTVYGQPAVSLPITESSPTNPICTYGVVKLTIERYLALYKKLHAVDYVIARVANPYGPWQDPHRGQGVIAALIFKATAHQPVEVWGDGENIRDYLFVSDLTRHLLELAQFGESGDIYNVGSQVGLSINQLITTISETLDLTIHVNRIPARDSDVRYNVLDVQKLASLKNLPPSVSLKAGILRTAQWQQSRLIVLSNDIG